VEFKSVLGKWLIFERTWNEVIVAADYTTDYELRILLKRMIFGREKVRKTHLS
jgi:hypothetical protein